VNCPCKVKRIYRANISMIIKHVEIDLNYYWRMLLSLTGLLIGMIVVIGKSGHSPRHHAMISAGLMDCWEVIWIAIIIINGQVLINNLKKCKRIFEIFRNLIISFK
jgi:hypothetical protein